MRWKHARLALGVVTACWAFYTLLSFFAPPSANAHLKLSPTALFLLRLTIIIPLYFIWTTAARGASNFKRYALLVHGGAEGRAINDIANGLLWTLAYLIMLSLGGSLLQFFVQWRYFDVLVVLRDHLPVVAALIGFFLLYRGSDGLRHTAQFTTWTPSTFIMLAGFAAFSIGFVLAFTLAVPDSPTRTSMDIMPRGLLLTTQIMPYLAAWFMGILAGVNIAKFAANVKGVLYRRALRNVVLGIWGVVVFSVILQALTLASRYLLNWSVAGVILLVYALMAFYSFGFILINSGAKSLTRLEVPE
jgi:hypothetical protein